MDGRVTPPMRVTSPTWGPPPPENWHLILMTLLAQRISPAGREVNLQGSTHLFRLSITLYTYHSSPDRDTWRVPV